MKSSAAASATLMASPTALAEVTQAVGSNLNAAFTRHAKELDDLSKSRRTLGLKLTSFVTNAAITVAGAITGNVPLAVASGLAGMMGMPTLKDLRGDWQGVSVKTQRLKQSATGILFKHIGKT